MEEAASQHSSSADGEKLQQTVTLATTLDKPHESFLDTLLEDRFMQAMTLGRGVSVAYDDNINPYDNVGNTQSQRNLRKTLRQKRTAVPQKMGKTTAKRHHSVLLPLQNQQM